MAIVKTCELTGKALDWAVAKAMGYALVMSKDNFRKIAQGAWSESRIEKQILLMDDFGCYLDSMGESYPVPKYSTDWARGGPIIEQELIATIPAWHNAGYDSPTGFWDWAAYMLGPDNLGDNHEQRGPTPLIAAMRCLVISKLGETVEIPAELLEQ